MTDKAYEKNIQHYFPPYAVNFVRGTYKDKPILTIELTKDVPTLSSGASKGAYGDAWKNKMAIALDTEEMVSVLAAFLRLADRAPAIIHKPKPGETKSLFVNSATRMKGEETIHGVNIRGKYEKWGDKVAGVFLPLPECTAVAMYVANTLSARFKADGVLPTGATNTADILAVLDVVKMAYAGSVSTKADGVPSGATANEDPRPTAQIDTKPSSGSCEGCSYTLDPARHSKVIDYSKKKYGKILCIKCQERARNQQ